MPSCGEIVSEQARSVEGCLLRKLRILAVERRVGFGGRQRTPERWPEPLHAAALLVDQHEKLVAADRLAHVADQPADLIVGHAVAGEQDETRRGGGAKK